MVRSQLRNLTRKIALGTAIVVTAVAGSGLLGWGGLVAPPTAHADNVCVITAKLVNTCRPWLGAAANGYSGLAAGHENQIYAHEQRIGRQLDIVHLYHVPGTRPLSAEDKLFASRANTILSVNWKPAEVWASAAGADDNVNAAIDSVADDFLSMGSTKIMLTLYHEPEDQVSGGANGCADTMIYKGSSGTPADYRNMWRNVHDRFAAKGVKNVVWVMNYMGFSNWDCMVDDLWPGNDIVDWVMWDPYTDTATFNDTIGRFYNVLETASDTDHDFTAKPWGLAEWGSWHSTTREHTYSFYDDAKAAIEQNLFPRLKAYDIFDSGGATRVAYDKDGVFDQTEVDHYKALANSPALTGNAVPDQEVPGAPADVAAVYDSAGRSVSLTWSAATDDVAVKDYSVLRDGVEIARTTNTAWNDSQVTTGMSYTYTVVAHDYAANSSVNSTPLTFLVPDIDAPTAVGNLTATVQGASVALNWTPATDNMNVAGYSVTRDGVQIATTTGLTYTDSNVPDGRTYTYGVTAYDGSGNTAATVFVTVTILDSTAPTIPTGLKGTSTGTQTQLTWNAATDNVGVTGYNVYRDSVLIAKTTSTTFTDTAIVQGRTYRYQIEATDAAGNIGTPTTAVSVTVPDITAPTQPPSFTWMAGTRKVTLNWKSSTDNVGIAGYRLMRNGVLIATLPATTLTYTDSGLVSRKSYTYKLYAFDAAGNVSSAAAVTATPK